MKTHPYKSYILENTEILIIGTTPPNRFYEPKNLGSNDVDWFYGSNRNYFWKLFNQLFDIDLKFENLPVAVEERQAFCKKNKIGITDIVCQLVRLKENDASDDAFELKEYRKSILDDLINYPIKKVCFTSSSGKNNARNLFIEFINKYGQEKGIQFSNEKIILPNNREIETINLISPSPRVKDVDKKLKQYGKVFLTHLIPEWQKPKGLALVYPEKLVGKTPSLVSFYDEFIQIIIQNTDIEELTLIHRPNLKEKLQKQFKNDRIRIRTIESRDIQDIWIRDFAPIIKNEIEVIKANYYPSYFPEKDLKYAELDNKVGNELAKELQLKSMELSDNEGYTLILDGGNFIHNGQGTAIVSNRVISDNEILTIKEIKRVFLDKLQISNLIFVPVEPEEKTGHIDGSIRFIDEKTIFLSDYDENVYSKGKKHFDKVKQILDNEGFTVFSLKTFIGEKEDDIDGIYLNFLRIGKQIYLPQFGNKIFDTSSQEFFIKSCPNLQIIPIPNVQELAQYGGALNCFSWLYF